MSRAGRRETAEERWLESLRYGYTDVHRTVKDRRSFDAQWADSHWAHAAPRRQTTALPVAHEPEPGAPLDGPPPRDEAAAAGRTFFLILFWFTLAVSVELWWLNTPANSITDASGVFLAIGRITGMVGGFVLLFQILLMSRVGWLECWIGAHDLLIWHPKLRQEALTAQSATIATVSGATYTSNAYKQSLAAAVNAAKA
jgi:FMN-binding domain